MGILKRNHALSMSYGLNENYLKHVLITQNKAKNLCMLFLQDE
jgi:hypothetical protein